MTSTSTGQGPAAPPTPLDTRPLKLAGVAVVVVAVVVGVISSRPAKIESLPPVNLPIDAVQCRRIESEGKDLLCIAEPASLNGLAADDRARRLTLTRTLASAAGFTRVVFRESATRVWRVEDLTLKPATTTDQAKPPAP